MMRRNNSLLIESTVARAESETGSRPSRTGMSRLARIPIVGGAKAKHVHGRSWDSEEDEYLRRNLGRITYAEIARHLGRTVTAVNLRWKRDLHLPAPRRHPEWLTLEQIAVGIGKDGHSITKLADRGILPTRCPYEVANIRVVERQVLLKWILDPMHWCYFDTNQVGAFKPRTWRRRGRPDIVFWRTARQQVLAARKAWKDEWLLIGKAAKFLKFEEGKWHNGISRLNNAIHAGILQATDFGNWWILRSELERFARERIKRIKWGKRMVNYISFNNKPRLPLFSTMTKAEWTEFTRKRLQSDFFVQRRRRDEEIRQQLKHGATREVMAKKYRMTTANVRRIEKGK
jgi:hypothetical protein